METTTRNPAHTAASPYERALAASLGGGATALAFGHARTALVALLGASSLTPGSQVVLSPLTCKVVPLAIRAAGLVPRFVDVDRATLNLDPRAVAAIADPEVGAVLVQNTYGILEGRSELVSSSAEHGWMVIEDCAQCVPHATPDYAPGRSRASIFSNNLMKPLSAGSGGFALIRDPELAARVTAARDALPTPGALAHLRHRLAILAHNALLSPASYWRLFGLARRLRGSYRTGTLEEEIAHEIVALAHRPSAWQERRGLRTLSSIDRHVAHRQRRHHGFHRALAGRPGLELPGPAAPTPLYYCPLLVEEKNALLAEAERTRTMIVGWPVGTPIYPVERAAELAVFGYEPGSCPVAEEVARSLVGLPTDPMIDDAHAERIVGLVERHLG